MSFEKINPVRRDTSRPEDQVSRDEGPAARDHAGVRDRVVRANLQTIRSQFLDGAARYPGLRLMIVTARQGQLDKLEGPPFGPLREDPANAFTEDLALDGWFYRLHLAGVGDGVTLAHELKTTCDRCLRAIPAAERSDIIPRFEMRFGIFGLTEHLARYKLAGAALSAERATWDADSRFVLRSNNQIQHQFDVFATDPDYYYSILTPNVFSACVYAIDFLLNDGGARTETRAVSTARLRRNAVRKRTSRRDSLPLTKREQHAWTLYNALGSYTAVGKDMIVSRQAATRFVEIANAKLKTLQNQSVRTRSLPHDDRGQTTISNDR